MAASDFGDIANLSGSISSTNLVEAMNETISIATSTAGFTVRDSSSTTQSASDLETLVNTTISNYNISDLQTFNAPFRHSKLLGLIDNTDTAILNNTTTVTLSKLFTPVISTSTNYKLNFNNKFLNTHSGHNSAGGGVIASTGFYLNNVTTTIYFFDDNGAGNLRVYSIVSGERVYLDSAAGTVDYVNGIININSIIITGVGEVNNETSSQIRVTVIPNSYDVTPVRNQILEIDLTNTSVSAGVDATATTGVGYTTTTTTTGTTTTNVSSTSSTPTSSAY